MVDNDTLTIIRKFSHFSHKDTIGLKKCQYFDAKIQKFYDRIGGCKKQEGKKQEARDMSSI